MPQANPDNISVASLAGVISNSGEHKASSLSRITVLCCLLPLTAFIAESGLAAQPVHVGEAGAQAPVSPSTSALLRPASLFKPDEQIMPGDLLAVSRAFGDWTMHCEMRLSTNRKICAVEQSVTGEGGGLVWRVTQSEANKPIVLFSVPSTLKQEQGLHLSFSGLEKTIPGSELLCSEAACVAAVAFEGVWQTAIKEAHEISFSYTAVTAGGKTQTISLNAGMAGFNEALQAATENPFGQKEAVSIASVQDLPPQRLAPPETVSIRPTAKPETDPAEPENQPTAKIPSPKVVHSVAHKRTVRKKTADQGGLF